MSMLLAGAVVCAALPSASRSADWPMYRADAARNGYTPDQPPRELSLQWSHKPGHAPRPAWPDETRMPFDRAFQPVIAGGVLYFGSSADDTVYALDAVTGALRWSFVTGGPVRFAPAVWQDRVFVASDDGCLYGLSAADGRLLWKRRGGPTDEMVLGNGRMVSRWAARGGPVVVNHVVYFAAGIWPADGVYLHALDAVTGNPVWVTSSAGRFRRGHPHSSVKVLSGVGLQGYLTAGESLLIAPTGRSLPAVFSLKDGALKYFLFMSNGGGDAVVARPYLFSAGYVNLMENGRNVSRGINTAAMAVTPDWIVHGSAVRVTAINRREAIVTREEVREGTTRRRQTHNVVWTAGTEKAGGTALVVAGQTVFSSGGNKVVAIDAKSKAIVWRAEVDGTARGLAVADGRLYVSTDRGTIYCFGGGSEGSGPREGGAASGSQAASSRELHRLASNRWHPGVLTSGATEHDAAAAEEIIRKTGITSGYGLDLGCGDGGLALELAKRTDLLIYAIDEDARNVALARRRLAAAGLYGVRVTVHQGDPAKTPYPDYFANLIVSGRSVSGGPGVVPADEIARHQRPFGGTLCVGKPGAMTMAVRGPLEGAGEWTHQYANAANTGCSDDAIVKGPLGVAWFGSPHLTMPNRHGRPPAPLFVSGRLYVQGLNAVRAIDAYNGRVIWEVAVPGIGKPYDQDHLVGTAITGSTLCASKDSVYVRTGSTCRRLDGRTGKQLAAFEAPKQPDGKPSAWGFVAVDGGVLFGTQANERHVVPYRYQKADMSRLFSESTSLFAVDATTGETKWTYTAEQSIRHNTIAIGGGRVYLIDRELAAEQTRSKPLLKPHVTGVLLALDAGTGRVLWRSDEDVYGTVLILSTKHDVLLMCYQPGFRGFGMTSELGGRLAAFRASTGERLWDVRARYERRPILNDRTIHLTHADIDLLTGTQTPWRLKRQYGCGILTGGKNILLFRSAVLGYVDLLKGRDTQLFPGIRPGCWINAIPAGGLVLMPDFSEKCSCAYLNKTTMALQPVRPRREEVDRHE